MLFIFSLSNEFTRDKIETHTNHQNLHLLLNQFFTTSTPANDLEYTEPD